VKTTNGNQQNARQLLQPMLILWVCIAFALIYSSWGTITSRSGWDPDDQLRLVQLRDFLNGQSWFDTNQYRLNPPDGGPMHWSRLIELPLALIVIIMTPLFGPATAEMIAGTFIPLLGLGLVAYMLGRIATAIHSIEAGLVATGIALIAPALLMQFRPMRIDHHGWQIVMATLSLWTLFWPNKKTAGTILGCALATWLHISLEGAPLTAAFFILLGWRWIFDRAHGLRLLWTISAFVVASLTLFFGTQARGIYASIYCDTVSPPHLAAILAAAIIMISAISIRPSDRRLRLAAAGAAAVAAGAALLYFAPQCATGAFGNLDPLVRDYWYINVNEGLPVWRQDMTTALSLLAGPVCAIAALYIGKKHIKIAERSNWHIAGFFALYSAALSFLVFRTVSVASAFAIPLVAIWIVQLFGKYRKAVAPVQRIGLVAAMLALIIPGAVLNSITKSILPQESAANVKLDKQTGKCESVSSLAKLDALPKGNIVAPFDMGAAILLTTRHSVLATSHHRNQQAMHDHIKIFRSPAGEAWTFLDKHGINYIAVCANEAEMDFYETRDPKGLWAILAKGNWPGYLERLPDMGSGIKVWRVRG
jgi:hypothetical protein